MLTVLCMGSNLGITGSRSADACQGYTVMGRDQIPPDSPHPSRHVVEQHCPRWGCRSPRSKFHSFHRSLKIGTLGKTKSWIENVWNGDQISEGLAT